MTYRTRERAFRLLPADPFRRRLALLSFRRKPESRGAPMDSGSWPFLVRFRQNDALIP